MDQDVHALRRFNRFFTRIVGALNTNFLDSGMTLAEARVLFEIAHTTPCFADAIQQTLDLDAGFLSRLLRRFESNGWIKRPRLADDARRRTIQLLPPGRALVRKLDQRQRREAKRLLGRLSEPDRKRLIAALDTARHLLGDGEPTPVRLRSFAPGDMGLIVSRQSILYHTTYGWNAGIEINEAEVATAFLKNFKPGREQCWVAEVDGQIAGSIFLTDEGDGLARLRLLYVEPAFQGRGIGETLVATCIAFARQVGYTRITLWTHTILEGARRLYARHGFRLVDQREHSTFGPTLMGETWELDLSQKTPAHQVRDSTDKSFLLLFFKKEGLPPPMIPAIIGLSGPTLTQPEHHLLATTPPTGIILFARNIQSPTQLTTLTTTLLQILLPGAILMIDQEGGRVARLRPPHWRAHPPARAHTSDRAAYLTGALIGAEAAALGLTTICAPILDTPPPNGHDIIGDRAFSTHPHVVATRAAAFAAGLLAAGIQPVGKHAPGHGRATADSHLTLPELDTITEDDLIPFIANNHLPWLMTAHIRYTQQDMHNPATLSPAIIETIIRGRIGFSGVLVSDDLAMHALSGPPGARAAHAVAAGCDIALHCSGILEESAEILASLPAVTPVASARLAAARAMAEAARQPLNPAALAAERDALLA